MAIPIQFIPEIPESKLDASAQSKLNSGGASNASVKVVTTQAELIASLTGTQKELSIQADFTLTSNVTIPDGAILSDGGGKITVSTFDITFVNNSFKSDYNRIFIDLGQSGTINDASTFLNGDINIVWFGLVGDGTGDSFGGSGTNTGTDNRNVFIQAQKIYNYNGGNAVIKGEGVYMFNAVVKDAWNGNPPTNLFIEGKATLTLDNNVTIGVLPNNLVNYRTFTLWNSTGYLKGGEIVGDERHHTFVGQYDEGCHGITVGGASRGAKVLRTKAREFSGDCISPFVVSEVVFATSYTGDSESIKENAFTHVDGAKGALILDTSGTKTSASTSSYIGSNWNYSRFYSLASAKFTTAELMMIGGDVAYGGQSGLVSNAFYIAYYSDVVDGGTGEYTFIERTELVEQYQLLDLKTEYKYFRIILPTPNVWADLDLNVYAPLIPLNTIIEETDLSFGVRQGISNISPYTKVLNNVFDNNGARHTGETGSPAYHIDIEDFYQGLNNIEIAGNTFGNAKQGILILKGTKYAKIHDNIVKYPTDPNYSGRTWSTANGHDTQVYNNTLRLVDVFSGRRDNYNGNTFYDCLISTRLEEETLSNNAGYNTRFQLTSTDTGTETTTYQNNNWYYDRPLDGSQKAVIILNTPNWILKNETFDFNNISLNSDEVFVSIQNQTEVGEGYIDGLTIKRLKAASGVENTQGYSWITQNIKNLKSSVSVGINQGLEQDLEFENWFIEGFVKLNLNQWSSDNTSHNNIRYKNLNIDIINASELNSNNAFTCAAKDANILVEGGSINIKIGTDANASNFLGLSNTGTKVFKNVTFYTDQAGSTQALDNTYEFIDCTFTNITFTGATITTGTDGLSAYEVAVNDGFVGDETAWLASLVGADGADGATGATGATNGNIQIAYAHFDTYDKKAIIDVTNETITFPAYSTYFLRGGKATASNTAMKEITVTSEQVLDFSPFLTLNVSVYVIYNSATGLFSASSTVSSYTASADNYFVTSFKRFTGQEDINLSLNQHAFKIKGNSDEYVQNWTVLGDSHTFAGGTWTSIVSRGFEKINIGTNLGLNGSDIAGTTSSNSFWDRKSSIPASTDLLTIFGGTNDFEHTTTIGTIQPIKGTFDETTVIGALQGIIEYAFTVNPLMRINIITPHYHYDANTNGSMYNLDSYVDAIKSVADLYGLPVLDLQQVLGINELTYPSFMNTSETKPIHLNTLGREKAGHSILQFIKANY